MKYRHRKIKREHSIIEGGLDWLESLSKNREVRDIIPGVIDVTNSKERGIFYKYETSTGCKLFLKNRGSIQEVFVVTKNPQAVRDEVKKLMEELALMQAAVDNLDSEVKPKKDKTPKPKKQVSSKNKTPSNLLGQRNKLLTGIKEDYQLVEINQGLRDSLVDSLASMADLDKPKLEEALNPAVVKALKKYVKKEQ
ncbi:MAG: DUF2103 domain-containing protein [Desulfitobacteriia bacterium]|jgi:hypothetical protein